MDKIEFMAVRMTSERLPLPGIPEIPIADSNGDIVA
jgi:hypothetical protein